MYEKYIIIIKILIHNQFLFLKSDKNSEAIKLIMHLTRRAKLIQIEPLTPLVRNQCHSLFDNYDDHMFLLQFMEEFGTRLG